MAVLYSLSVVVHLLAAMTWAGGIVFLVAVVVPVSRMPAFKPRAVELVDAVATRYMRVAWIALATLVVTGVFNARFRAGSFENLISADFWSGPFGHVLAAKIVLVLILLVIEAYHDLSLGPRAIDAMKTRPDAPETARLRRRASILGRANGILTLLVIVLAVMLVRGVPF
ncbi:CopD family protein [bacterium]|nr:CopD family protein [bacterium]